MIVSESLSADLMGYISFWLAIASRGGELVFGSGAAAAKHYTSLLSVC